MKLTLDIVLNVSFVLSYFYSFDAERPGVVFAREDAAAEPVEFQLLREAHHQPPPSRPPVQAPPGLDLARQKYLFEKIREFCSDEAKDVTCPPPVASDPLRM